MRNLTDLFKDNGSLFQEYAEGNDLWSNKNTWEEEHHPKYQYDYPDRERLDFFDPKPRINKDN